MDTRSAVTNNLSSRGRRPRVFDWDTAARRIRETGASYAEAGLGGDWEWTGGAILAEGVLVPSSETYTYLASTWAVPELELEGEGPEQCWVYQDESPGWHAGTYWPDSALEILRLTSSEESANVGVDAKGEWR